MQFLKTLGVTALFVASAGVAQAGETLDAVKAKGFVQCGVSQGLPGFSNPEVSKLSVRYTAKVIAIISTACPVWFSVVPANTENKSG